MLGIDVDPGVVDTINAGDIHIVEPELDILVRSAVGSGNLRAALTPDAADVFIIAVPTPFKGDHEPELAYVDAATQAIAPHVQAGNLVILESTSPVGTTERVAALLAEARPELTDADRIFVAHCPERVLPGHILRELVENDRIVGGVDVPSTDAAVAFYDTFVSGEVIATNARTAEMCKLTENSYRDTNIAFANELSMLCSELGMNVWELIRLANRHPRVSILNPGAGVGGHCLAVDPWFIVHSAPDTARLIRTSREVNDHKAHWVVERALEKASRFREPVVACLGIAYKPDIDDLRESPALDITKALTDQVQGTVLAVEPNVDAYDGLDLVSVEEALSRADIVVALVSHREFTRIDRALLQDKVLIDACGVFR